MSHEHAVSNECTEPACPENPISRRLRRVLRFTTWSNVTLGLVQIGVGLQTGSSAALSDGIHNSVEVFGHSKHTKTHVEEQHAIELEDKQQAIRKIALQRKLAAVGIAAAASFAGYQAVDHFVHREQEPLNAAALAVEVAGLGLNYGLKRAVAKNNDGSMAAKDSLAHNTADTRISAVAVASIVLNPIIPGADAVGGMYGAYKSFRLASGIWTDSHAHNHD